MAEIRCPGGLDIAESSVLKPLLLMDYPHLQNLDLTYLNLAIKFNEVDAMSMRLNFKRFKPENHGISVSAHSHISQYMWIKLLTCRPANFGSLISA